MASPDGLMHSQNPLNLPNSVAPVPIVVAHAPGSLANSSGSGTNGPIPAAGPAGANAGSINPTAGPAQAPMSNGMDVNDLRQEFDRMRSQLQLQEQQQQRYRDTMKMMTAQMGQMITAFNDMLLGSPAQGSMPNSPGWPASAIGTQPPPNQSAPPPVAAGGSAAMANLSPPLPAAGPQANLPLNRPPSIAHTSTVMTNAAARMSNVLPPASGAFTGANEVPTTQRPGPAAFTQAFPAEDHRLQPGGGHQRRQDVAGDGYDSTDSEYAGVARVANRPLGRAPLDRGRGHARLRGRGGPRDSYPRDEEAAYDPDDGYAMNRERRERNGKITIEKFVLGNKSQDFSIWVRQFEAAVNRALNPHTQARHYTHCQQWLPASLDMEAYAIWERQGLKESGWAELKKELEIAFEDPAIRSEWKTNAKAYMWDEANVSLQSYAAKVKRYVDTFDPDLAHCPAAKYSAYYTRFYNGLPDDYAEHVKMSMPSGKDDIDKALDICIRFQAVKRMKAQGKPEVAAAADLQDPSMPARITKNETEIVRLNNKVDKLRSSLDANATTPSHYAQRDRQPGGVSYRQTPRDSSGGSYRSGSRERQSSGSSYVGDPKKMEDRVNRLMDRRNNYRGTNYRPRDRANSFRSQDRGSGQNRTPDRKGIVKFQEPSQPTSASLEESLALQTDVESGAEDLDDTVVAYEESERQRFEAFCVMHDLAKLGN